MAIQIQLRQGTSTEHDSFTGAVGEVTVDTTNKTLRVHDGSTVGGTRLVTLTGGLVPAAQLPAATTSVQGAVILNNTLTSTSTTQALTAAQGKVLKDTLDTAFGIGQTLVDVTASRISGTTYTNTKNTPIFVIATTAITATSQSVSVVVNGITFDIRQDGDGSCNTWPSFIVPAGGTYSITASQSIIKWCEF